MTTNNLSGKNIVIIGGTAGIGLATAVAASELGANVWAAGRTQAHIDKAKDAHCIAYNQLSQGKGNLISQLEGIERIGLSVQKQTVSRFAKQIEVDGQDEVP